MSANQWRFYSASSEWLPADSAGFEWHRSAFTLTAPAEFECIGEARDGIELHITRPSLRARIAGWFRR